VKVQEARRNRIERRDHFFKTPPGGAEVQPDLMAMLIADFPTPKFPGHFHLETAPFDYIEPGLRD
jgi:hypothetical protein